MRLTILGLAAVLATLLVADMANAGCRHAGGSFGFAYGGHSYHRQSALLLVRSAPVYVAAEPCPVPVPVPDVVPPLALAVPSYGAVYGGGYAGGFLADTGVYYDYRAFRGTRRGFVAHDYGFGGGFRGRRLPPVERPPVVAADVKVGPFRASVRLGGRGR